MTTRDDNVRVEKLVYKRNLSFLKFYKEVTISVMSCIKKEISKKKGNKFTLIQPLAYPLNRFLFYVLVYDMNVVLAKHYLNIPGTIYVNRTKHLLKCTRNFPIYILTFPIIIILLDITYKLFKYKMFLVILYCYIRV